MLVEAPARLHMGFIDLHGGLGRRFGSLGLAIAGPKIQIAVARAGDLEILGDCRARVRALAVRLSDVFGWALPARIETRTTIPEHVGLGSGTQLALAVGTALARLHGHPADARAIARVVSRGARSGIGIGAFEQGGFVLDGGRGSEDGVPPLIARLPFPEHWRLLLVSDRRAQGLHGGAEQMAFGDLPPFPESTAARLSRLCLMRILPALAERNLASFGAGITELQGEIGDCFAAVQGGRFTSAEVGAALAWLSGEGATAVGQSSWGPTGFCVVESETRARALIRDARRRFAEHGCLDFATVAARNHGGVIEASPTSQRPALIERSLSRAR